jgi:rRNA maturation protein Nop10
MGIQITPVDYRCKECGSTTAVHCPAEPDNNGGFVVRPSWTWDGQCSECGEERHHHLNLPQ